MNDNKVAYTGRWLHHGDQHGKEFTHDVPDYSHTEGADGDAEGTTPMRHAVLVRDGHKTAVWIPADWTDDQARDALESNW